MKKNKKYNYWFRTFRINKSTDKKLTRLKKKSGKTWDGFFGDVIEILERVS